MKIKNKILPIKEKVKPNIVSIKGTKACTFFAVSFFLITFLVIWLVMGAKKTFFNTFFEETLYIAVAGPMNGTEKINGDAMIQGVQLYLDQINQRGGIDGRQVKLLPFDDENAPEKAKTEARKIIDSKALAVIGHYASSPSLAVAPIYQKYSLPAITGTATNDDITKDNDWYFRVTFNNSDQGAVLANYVHKILGYQKAYVFYDEDDYGKTLKEAFIQTASKIGLQIEKHWGFNKSNFEEQRKKVIKMLAEEENPGILFLATHSQEAIKTIKSLLLHLETPIPIIGGDALTSRNFTQILKEDPREQVYPGSYTDGIYAVSPFLIDMAGKHAQQFREVFKKYSNNKGKEESVDSNNLTTVALYYDAAMVAVDAIKKMLADDDVNKDSLLEKRQGVQKHLLQLSNVKNALEGVTGDLYFDKNGDAIKSVPIGLYRKGKPTVAWFQYQPLKNLQTVDNLVQEILDNQIIQVNDKFMQRAHVVYVGVDFNNISNLDVNKRTYSTDFYLWFRFKRDKQTQVDFNAINLINIFQPNNRKQLKSEDLFVPICPFGDKSPANPQNKNNNKPDNCEVENSQEGSITKVYRLKTQFKVNFDFRDYPLDQQTLPIQFRHKNLTTKDLIYVVDRQGMGIDNLGFQEEIAEKMGIKQESFKQEVFSMGGEWQVKDVSFFQDSQRNDSTLGIPKLFDLQERLEYSRFNAEIEIGRDVWRFILKNLLPLLFVVMLGYVAYWTDEFGIKMALNINLILSTSLFHLKISSGELASVGYYVLIEWIFYIVYFLAIAGILASLFFKVKKNKVGKMEAKLEKLENKLEKLNEAKDGKEEANLKVQSEIKQVQSHLDNTKIFIKCIDRLGMVIYPFVLFVAILIMFYKHIF